MPNMTIEDLNRRFKIVPTSLFKLPCDLSKTPEGQPLEGDCQDHAKTVRRILKVKPWQAVVWRCWSPQNGLLPRHAVLYCSDIPRDGFMIDPSFERSVVRDQNGNISAILDPRLRKGWIDSTVREWRDSPAPHRRCWPVGTPFIAFVVWQVGIHLGWWPGVSLITLAAAMLGLI